jgi:hypothetical protein
MSPPIAFDTLKLAERLEAAGMPPQQACDTAAALADTIGESVVTREYLDLRFAETKADLMKWMFGATGLQIVAILGGVAGRCSGCGIEGARA